MRLTVKVFRATDAPEDCRRNAVACLQVLRRYGIANITSAKQDWWANPEVYALLLVDSHTGAPLGALRRTTSAPGAIGKRRPVDRRGGS